MTRKRNVGEIAEEKKFLNAKTGPIIVASNNMNSLFIPYFTGNTLCYNFLIPRLTHQLPVKWSCFSEEKCSTMFLRNCYKFEYGKANVTVLVVPMGRYFGTRKLSS